MAEDLILDLQINPSSTLPPVIKAWETYLRDQNRSIYTIRSFLGDIRLLASFLPPDRTLAEITTTDLNQFLEWVQSGRGKNIPCSPKSYSRRITTIKSFFRWLFKHARISTDPAETILQHTVISPLPEVLTPAEENIALQIAENLRFTSHSDVRPYSLFKLLLETGIKKSECINITGNHIDSSQTEPYLFVRYPSAKDRNKERKIKITTALVAAINEYKKQYEINDKLFPWSPRRLEYILEDIGKSAKLNKHLSFSMCRWTCALNDFRNGIDPDAIRQKLGVSKIQWRELKLKLEQLTEQKL